MMMAILPFVWCILREFEDEELLACDVIDVVDR
jgi:hypothetical protein